MPRIDGRYVTGPISEQRFISDGVASYFSKILGNGVTALGTNLQVTAEFPDIFVKNGDAFLGGFLFRLIDDGGGLLTLTETSGTRKDRVIIRMDTTTGAFTVYIKQGTATPPALESTATVTEISLALLDISGSSVTITDERTICEMILVPDIPPTPTDPEEPSIWGGI